MARYVTVITPENIPLTLEPAGIGTRFGALLLDYFILVAGSVALFLVGLIVWAILSLGGLSSLGSALLIIAMFLVFFGYFLLFETIWNGQTPGNALSACASSATAATRSTSTPRLSAISSASPIFSRSVSPLAP